jgi:hypothetical protein
MSAPAQAVMARQTIAVARRTVEVVDRTLIVDTPKIAGL